MTILIVAVAILSILLPIFSVCCLILGMRIGKTEEKMPILDLKPQKKQKKVKKDPKIERFEAILSNIDAYDGTGFGQKDL